MEDRSKLRAWDKHLRMMLPVGSIFFAEKTVMLDIVDDEGYVISDFDRDDKDVILMQCTGLRDRHGVLIYEDDILEWKSSNPEFSELESDVARVTWYCAGWYADTGTDYVDLGLEAYVGGYAIEWRVVGNIHDNTERSADNE